MADLEPTDWEYRVLHKTVPSAAPGGEPYEHFTIVEAYYDGDQIIGWAEADEPLGGTVAELRQDLLNMLEGAGKEVLEASELAKMVPGASDGIGGPDGGPKDG